MIEVFTSTNSDAAATEQSDSDGRLSKSVHADSAEQRPSESRRLALLCTG